MKNPHASPSHLGNDATPPAKPPRIGSIDAYRGFVMLLMLGEVLHLAAVAKALPQSAFWRILAEQQRHVAWAGCSLHDLIQPSFTFLVGVALPFSLASRSFQGQAAWKTNLHALWRGFVLVLLGVFLRSLHGNQTYWTFEDTLTQIGLGYPFLFLFGKRSPATQMTVLAAILVGYWAWWAAHPLPDGAVNFARHWNVGTNPAADFDRWFLNLFPRRSPADGSHPYYTLNFIPTLGTMLLGLVAGRWLREKFSVNQRLCRMLAAGIALVAAGLALHFAGLCPLVKQIWTPGWTLFSGGVCFLLMAAFYFLVDLRGWRAWAFPLIVIGTNSIAAYLMSFLIANFVREALQRHFGTGWPMAFGKSYAPLVQGLAVLLAFWLILWWMHRRKISLKV